MVFKDRMIGNTEFQKTVPYVTARPNYSRLSHREAKNNVWKYLQIIVIGLYAVCGHLLDYQDRALSLHASASDRTLAHVSCWSHRSYWTILTLAGLCVVDTQKSIPHIR